MCALERNRFFPGQLLTAEALKLEQDYFLQKLKRHNRSLHGCGVVSGLRVKVEAKQIVVEDGMALDCQGNEVVLESAKILAPSASMESWPVAYVNIRYAEDCGPEAGSESGVIRESVEIALGEENCNRAHRHLRARWLVCGKPHPLTLAKLRHNAQGWRLDRRYRAPTIK